MKRPGRYLALRDSLKNHGEQPPFSYHMYNGNNESRSKICLLCPALPNFPSLLIAIVEESFVAKPK